nr:MAG TPA: hypothetical protein [Caudoviricetes sp.]
MPEQTSGILPEQYLQANLANGRELRNQPHIGLFKHLLQQAVQFFPIAFAGIAVQAVRLHRLHLHFGIRENLVHPLRQLVQNDFSGPFEPFNISLVINQLNEHHSPSLLT